MNLDLLVLGTLVAFAVAGAASGALRQLVNLGAAVLGWLAARHLAAPVAAGLGRGAPEAIAHGVAAVALFLATFVAAGAVGRLAIRAHQAGQGGRGAADRGLGALLGAAQGGLALWVALSALAIVGRPVGPAWLRLDPRASDFGGLAREHNLLDRWEGGGGSALRALLRVARDPDRASRLLADADGRALLEDPRVRSLVEEARGGADPVAMTGSTAAVRLLSDPVFLERLARAQRAVDEAAVDR